jgi:hypothetical protein
MFNHFLTNAREKVNEINNYVKSNAEICMDFMMRLNVTNNSEMRTSPGIAYQQLLALGDKMDLSSQEIDSYIFAEENY